MNTETNKNEKAVDGMIKEILDKTCMLLSTPSLSDIDKTGISNAALEAIIGINKATYKYGYKIGKLEAEEELLNKPTEVH
jgi:hypothetical protein